MLNLTAYYETAQKSHEAVLKIVADIDAAFNDGTEEGRQRALDLRPSLDEAEKKARADNELYISVRKAAQMDDEAAKLFVPVTEPEEDSETDKKTRAEFSLLEPAAQMQFIKSGGSITD